MWNACADFDAYVTFAVKFVLVHPFTSEFAALDSIPPMRPPIEFTRLAQFTVTPVDVQSNNFAAPLPNAPTTPP